MDLPTIAQVLASNPLAWIAVLSMAAVVYLFKELRASDNAALERATAQEAAHRTTLEKILPLAEKLTDAVEVLERLSMAGK